MSSDVSTEAPYVGALMRLGARFTYGQILAGVMASGFDDITPAHIGVFRYPSPEGQRPSDIADKLHITKQSVNGLLDHLERSGYLAREPHPLDGRARVVRLTAKGRELDATIVDQARRAELSVFEVLGPERFAHLRGALTALAEHTGEM